MSVAHVYKAIGEITAVMAREGIAKSRENRQQGYRFRSVDDVYAALGGLMAEKGLCMLPRVTERASTERPTKNGGVSTYTTLTVEFDLVSAVDGSKHTICTVGEAMDTADKSSNKAMSAAFKYACFLTFQIPTEGDNDSDFSHHEKIEPPSFENVLDESVKWGDWEKRQALDLRGAGTMGELLERWTAVSELGKGSPNGTMKRLAAIKDQRKAQLGNGRQAAAT